MDGWNKVMSRTHSIGEIMQDMTTRDMDIPWQMVRDLYFKNGWLGGIYFKSEFFFLNNLYFDLARDG
jgi:hypothetical protein